MEDVRDRAAQLLLKKPVRLGDLALAFEETMASTADVHVGGRNFFPPILDDIASAASSVHVNQFGFKPGGTGQPEPGPKGCRSDSHTVPGGGVIRCTR